MFAVFHLPPKPGPPDTLCNTTVSLEVSPVTIMSLELTVRVLPSAESFTVSVPVSLPLARLIVSQVVASTLFHAVVVPQGVGYSLPSALNVYDTPSALTFVSPPAICSYVTVVSPKSLFATFSFHFPLKG